MIFFANIPFFIFQIASEFFPPISLNWTGLHGFILIAGFTSQFGLERRLVARSVILIYAMFMLVWLWSRIDAMNFEKSMNQSPPRPARYVGANSPPTGQRANSRPINQLGE